MTPLQQIQDIFRNKQAFELFILTQFAKKEIAVELIKLMKDLANLEPESIEKEKNKINKLKIHYVYYNLTENSISNLVLEYFELFKNQIYIVANKTNYIKIKLAEIDTMLFNIDTLKKELPNIENIQFKKSLIHPKEWGKSHLQFSGFNEPAIDSLGLTALNEINLKIYHYSDVNFSQDEFFALCLKSIPAKLLRLKNEIEKYKVLPQKNKISQTTFHWIGKPEQLKAFWGYIRNNLIEEISFDDFKIIFSITPKTLIPQKDKRIKWKGNLRSLFEFLLS
ncbi:MAG: hypothetical protein AABZ32_01280 [Bacteroidota bacterium]